MVFNSFLFFVFLTLVISIYHFLPLSWKWKKHCLVFANYLFFASYYPPYILLLLFSTFVDWIIGNSLYKANNEFKQRYLVLISLSINLGLLFFFKYTKFFINNIYFLGGIKTCNLDGVSSWDILLPVGISFYTFQTLSYTLDIYYKKIKPANSFLDFNLYVSFFPQLVAGPIVRAKDFLSQLRAKPILSSNLFFWGLTLLTIGLFEKMILSDTCLAPIADKVFISSGSASMIDAWIGVMAFSGQIFFDFSGYSICAIGTAMCFGFALPDNFKFPYGAVGFSDFWKRWHITLSTWLRDYLYIPLGGNRHGQLSTVRNLLVTMLLGGLWHGASWTFVAWGTLHALYLIGEHTALRIWQKTKISTSRWIQLALWLITYYLVCIAWVFFRANSFEEALNLLTAMHNIRIGLSIINITDFFIALSVLVPMLAGHCLFKNCNLETLWQKLPFFCRIAFLILMILGIICFSGGSNGFIYFQF